MASPQAVASPPRRSRGFSSSGRSEKSHRSSGSGNKLHLTETAEEKARRSLQTKADPMIAMNEAQPNLVALERSNLGSLRAIQHKDRFGNTITEPDLSNPTRPRFERPLDTIRSFEAAIYGPYSGRPLSFARTAEESVPGADYSRRSSYYSGPNGYSNRAYNDQGGYGGHSNGRPNYSRPNSYIENGNGYYNGGGPPPENYYPYNQGGGRQRPRPQVRAYTDQPTYANNTQNGYTQNGYHRSYDNVTAGSGSGSGSNTDQWGNSTDPSSVNSSIDQLQQQQSMQQYSQQQLEEKPVAERYGFNGFGTRPNFNTNALGTGAVENPNYREPGPASAANPNIGGPVGGLSAVTAEPSRRHLQRKAIGPNPSDANDTKRKSWFKRRFSKN